MTLFKNDANFFNWQEEEESGTKKTKKKKIKSAKWDKNKLWFIYEMLDKMMLLMWFFFR